MGREIRKSEGKLSFLTLYFYIIRFFIVQIFKNEQELLFFYDLKQKQLTKTTGSKKLLGVEYV